MLEYGIYFAVFLAAILLFESTAAVWSARRERSQSINRRIAMLKDRPEGSLVLPQLLKERGIDEGGIFSWDWLRDLWTRSGVTISPPRFLFLTTAAAAGIAVVVGWVFSSLYAILGIFVVLAFWVPFLVLKRMKAVRIKQFTRQLPNALDVIVRSLRAGHPVTSSIGMVAREMPDPIGSEFGIVSDEITFGQDVEGAIANLYQRVGAEDLRLVVTTISVQRSTGGNLSEVLSNLSHVIRERLHMRARIKAISAEGRFTAYLMACFPFIMYFLITFFMPTYFDTFWESEFAVTVVVVCAFLLVIGNFILFKLVNFDF